MRHARVPDDLWEAIEPLLPFDTIEFTDFWERITP
jgi:hypothetical protein